MNKIYCVRVTEYYTKVAQSLNVEPIVIANLASIMYGAGYDNGGNDITQEDFRQKLEELRGSIDKFSLPAYQETTRKLEEGILAFMEHGTMYVKDVVSQNDLDDYMKKYFNSDELENLRYNEILDNPVILRYFIVWNQSLFLNRKNAETEVIKNHIKDTLNKCEEFKLTNIYKDFEKGLNTPQNQTMLNLDILRKVNEQHIQFNEDTHEYKLDGKAVDFSVTEYIHKDEKKEKEEGLYAGYLEVSSVLGTDVDNVIRGCFMGTIQNKKSLSEEEKYYIEQAEKIKKYIEDTHGKDCKIITDEKALRMAAKVKVEGKEITVAGTMDILVVDKNGDGYIYDFKTKRDNSRKGKTNPEELLSGKREGYSRQESWYKAMVEANCPQLKGKIHCGGFFVLRTKYPEPKGSRSNEKGTTTYALSKGKGKRKIFIIENGAENLATVSDTTGEYLDSSKTSTYEFEGKITSFENKQLNEKQKDNNFLLPTYVGVCPIKKEFKPTMLNPFSKENEDVLSKNTDKAKEVTSKGSDSQKTSNVFAEGGEKLKTDFVNSITKQVKGFYDSDAWNQKLENNIKSFIGEIYDAYVNNTKVKETDENTEVYDEDFIKNVQAALDEYVKQNQATSEEQEVEESNSDVEVLPASPQITQEVTRKVQKVNDAPLEKPNLKNQIQRKTASNLKTCYSQFNPTILEFRKSMIAHDFKSAIDDFAYDLKEEFKKKLKDAKDKKDLFLVNLLTQKLIDIEDPVKASKLVIREKTIDKVLDRVVEYYKEEIKFDNQELEKNPDNSYLRKRAEEYQKVLDNINFLLQESMPKIEALCDISLEFKEEEDEEHKANGNEGWGVEWIQQDPHDTVSGKTKDMLRKINMVDSKGNLLEDDLGNYIYMDEQKAHQILIEELSYIKNPKEFCVKSKDEYGVYWKLPAFEKIAKKHPWVRQIINTYEADSEAISAFYHDLRQDWIGYHGVGAGLAFTSFNKASGKQSFIEDVEKNFKYHNVAIADSAKSGISKNDTVYDEKGFMRKDVIDSYNNKFNDNKRSEFISGLRDFKNYLGQIEYETLEKIRQEEEDSTQQDIEYSQEEKTLLNDTYSQATRLVEFLKNENKERSNFCKFITSAVRSLGANVEISDVDSIFSAIEPNVEEVYYRLRNHDVYDVDSFMQNISDLCQDINKIVNLYYNLKYTYTDLKGSSAKNFNYLTSMKRKFNDLSNFFGQFMNQRKKYMFKIGTKSYSSYAAPNKIQTLIKHLSAPTKSEREKFIKEEFKNVDFFYKKGRGNDHGYRGTLTRKEKSEFDENKEVEIKYPCWLDMIENNNLVREKLEVVNVVRSEGLEYEEWDDYAIDKLCFAAYMGAESTSEMDFAYYNMNIFSDKTCALFVKAPKFTAAKTEYKKEILIRLAACVKQEMSRIKMCEDAKTHIDSPVNELYKRGLEFCFFPFLNTWKDKYKGKTVSFIEHYSQLVKDKGVLAAENYIESVMENYLEQDFEKYCTEDRINMFKELMSQSDNEYLNTLSENDYDVKAKLKEFFYNRYYAANQLIQITTTDPAFYKSDVDFQKRYFEVYAHGNRLNTQSQYGKEIANVIYLKDSKVKSNMIADIDKVLTDALYNGNINETQYQNILNKFKNITATDGQCYRSLSSYRSVLDMMGKWTQPLEDAYQRLKKGEFNVTDMNMVLQTIKDFCYSLQQVETGFDGKKLRVPVQYKNSEAPILAMYEMIAGPLGKSEKMKALCEFMEDHDIDMAQFESAVKVGGFNVLNLNEGDDENGHETKKKKDYVDIMKQYFLNEDGSFTNAVHKMPYDDYMIASATPEHVFDAKSVVGSQLRAIIPSRVPAEGVTVNGKHYTKEQFINLYKNIYIENALEKYMKLTGKFEDIESLGRYLQDVIAGNPRFNRGLREALEVIDVEDPNNPGKTIKTFNLPLHDPAFASQLETLFSSAFRNAIAKDSMKGAACILQADYTNTLEIVFNKKGDRTSGIKYVEIYMPWHSKRQLTPFLKSVKGEDGQEYYEIDYDKIKKQAPELLEGIGVRIPTEDLYSMVPFRIKAFLPQQYGSTVIMPSDFTQIAGSDFDVDKLFMLLKNYKIKYNAEQIAKEFNKQDKVLKVTPESVEEFLGNDETSLIANNQQFKSWFYRNIDKFLTLEVIKYDQEKDPSEQSMEARENMFIDMCKSVVCAPENAHLFFKTGNFDTIKKWGYIADILNDKNLITKYIESRELSFKGDDETKIKGLISALEADSGLKKFLEKYQEKRDPQSLDTWKYFHQQNMAGASLIGFYAINRLSFAKTVGKTMEYKGEPVSIDGIKIGSLTKEKGEKAYEDIASNCAEFIASAVDNAKDPVLAKLMQNESTAPVTSFLLKAGVPIKHITLLFNHPTIKEYAATGRFYSLLLKDWQTKENFKNRSFDTNLESWRIASDIIRGTKDYEGNVVNFFINIMDASQLNSDITQSNRADSPSGGASGLLSQLYSTVIKSENVFDKFKKDKGKNNLPLKVDNSIIIKPNLINTKTKTSTARDLLRKTSISQAAYTLGIDMIFGNISKFDCSFNLKNVAKFLYNEFGYSGFTKNFFLVRKGLFSYFMSKSDVFGDEEKADFYKKREYYLEQFPKDLPALVLNPITKNYPVVRALNVFDGKVILSDSNRLNKDDKEQFMNQLDEMLLRGDPTISKLAMDLFLYSFYAGGSFDSYNGFADIFSPHFKNQLPSYMIALKEMGDAIQNKGKAFELDGNMLSQILANNYDEMISTVVSIERKGVTVNEASELTVVNKLCFNDITGDSHKYIRIAENPGGYYQLIEEGEKSSKYVFVPGLADKYKSLYKFGASVAELREHVIEGEYEDIFQPEIETSNDELDDEQKRAYLYEEEQQKREQSEYDPNNTEATEEFC